MEKSSPYSQFVHKHEGILNDLRSSGLITRDEIRAMMNFKNKYSLKEQEAAFLKFKNLIQNRFDLDFFTRVEKDNSYDQNSVKSLKAMSDDLKKFDEKDPLLSNKLRKDILSSEYRNNKLLSGLADQISGMSDRDLREYLWVNRDYFKKQLTDVTIKQFPDLEMYLHEKPTFGVKKSDYGKMFNEPSNEEALKAVFNGKYDKSDIDFVARKSGMTGDELLKQMTEDKIKLDRENIAHGRWDSDLPLKENLERELSGTLLSLFGRRQQEAIARGEDPKKEDYIGDVGEQLLYTLPLGRVMQPGSLVGKGIYSGLTAAAVPHITEVYDMAAYGDDNPRGTYSELDALMGTGTNLAAPYGLRLLGRAGRKVGATSFTKPLEELGSGETAKEVSDRILKEKRAGITSSYGTRADLTSQERKLANEMSDLFKTDPKLWSVLQQNKPLLFEVAAEDGKNLSEKFASYLKKNNLPENTRIDFDVVKKDFQPKFGESAGPTKEFVEMYDKLGLGATEGLSTSKDLLKQDMLKNYLTNQFGNFTYGDENIRLPFLSTGSMFGIDLNQILKEKKAEKEREEAVRKAEEKYKGKISEIYGLNDWKK